jgi:ABC-type transport system substrate-binding protein/DNA-binding beta-propeller fold protein YncE
MLRVQVSRLRGVLDHAGDDARIEARPPGYVLRVEPGELDLDKFEQLSTAGSRAAESQDFELAARLLREAESLWRGRPLADLEFERFGRLDIERLEELRLAACEERIDAELALGRHRALVPELEALVAEHPLRERSRAQLMLALYRSGRQVDALAAYRSGRALLHEELALEPGPALRALEQSILRQESSLELLPEASGGLATAVAPPVEPPAPESAETVSPGRRRPAGRAMGVAIGLGMAAAGVIAAVVLGSQRSPVPTATADSIGMVDTDSGAVRVVLPAGGPPGGIAAGAGAVWETDPSDDLLLEINPATHSIERLPVGRGPTGVAVGDGEVWVVNQLDRTVSEINPRALTTVRSFAVGNGAGAATFGDGSLWVANGVDDTLSRIHPATGAVTTIPLTGQPAGIAIGPQGVWVTDQSTGQLLLIDPSTDQVTQAQEIGGQPAALAFGAGAVWAANTAERTVAEFVPGTGALTSINVGGQPQGIAYGDGAVWAADGLAGAVARIEPRSGAVRLIHIGGAPTAIALSGRQLWTTVLPGLATHLGGTLRVAAGPFDASTGSADPADPAEFAGLSQFQALGLTNDGLVTYRRVGGLAGSTIVPDLATGLPTPTEGGRSYTFQLRQGIRYSNGRLVRPEDFRHELERVFMLGNGYPQSFYAGVVGAQECLRGPRRCTLARGIVTDDAADTVTFHLTAPDPDFLYKLAFPWADAVPADTPDRGLGHAVPPATGPYMTQSITHGSGSADGHPLAFGTWTLVRNPRFRPWSSDAQPPGYPDKIVLEQGGSPLRAVADLERGSVDVVLAAPTNALSELAARSAEQLHSEPLGATFGLAMNTHTAPFDDVLVRRALNFAIDRKRIVDFVGGQLAARPTCQILPPNLYGYQPYCPYTLDSGPSGSWTAPDLLQAERLVAASRTRGRRVTLIVPSADQGNPTSKLGPYVVSVLDRLGYRASLRVLSIDTYYSTFADPRSHSQIGWFTWLQDYPAPSDFIGPLLTCHALTLGPQVDANDARFCDPQIDAGVQRAEALEPTAPGRASTAWATVDRQITRQAPWVPLYNPRLAIATSARVGNYRYHPFFGLLLDQLWVRGPTGGSV